MKQTGPARIPEIDQDLVIIPRAPLEVSLDGIKVQVRGIDDIGYPFDIRTLESAIPRDADDKFKVAERIGRLVENTVLDIMGLPVGDVK